jgi:hypothetical protein
MSIAFLISLIDAASLRAQNAQVSGRVTDPTGAVVPSTKVEVRNQATSGYRSTLSNADGLFAVPFLTPGVYTISADAKGFKRFEQTDVKLEAAQQAVVDLKLEVGAANDSVTVNGSVAPLVNSTDASVSTVVDRQFVENLPLNGRSFQSLIVLTPGVVFTPSSDSADQGQFSVAGQRAGSNYFSVDGVSANFAAPIGGDSGQTNNGGVMASSALGSTSSLVSVDAVQEFRLESSTYAPEFGRESGAQVVLVTRSGTNQFHGTAFDYFRNDAFDANDWFADSTAQPKPREHQNDFGGVLGGPIVKDKTFFFFSYEGLRLAQPKVALVDVPSLAARQQAPANVKPLLNAFPLPNGRSTGVDLSQLSISFSDPSSLDATSIRLDHAINSSLTVFGRYNHSPSSVDQRMCGGGGSPTTPSLICHKKVMVDTATIGATAILTPTITNDLRFNYSRYHGGINYTLDNFGGAVVPPDSALFSSFISPTNGFTGVLIDTGRNVGYWDTGIGTNHLNHQINITDSLSVVRGTHSLKFGFDFRRLTPSGTSYPLYTIYEWNYNTNPMPAFVSGASPDIVWVGEGPSEPNLRFHNFSTFAQDTWKASRRLTVTYGIRWDYNPPPTEANGNLYAISEITNLATATLLPKGSSLWHPDWKNFAPRLGISYLLRQNPEHSTILRIGVGQFNDIGTSTAGFLDAGFGWYPYSILNLPCYYGSGPACNGPVPYSGPKPPFVFTQPYPEMRVFDPQLKLPYSLQWNVALEQTLSHNQTVRLTYLGSAGRRLLWDDLVNNPSPIFSGLVLTKNTGYSNYDALQFQFQRRLSHGLQALVSYSWSHSLDTNSSDVSYGGAAGIPTTLVNVRQNYGDSDFDIRHTFSAAVTYNIPRNLTQNRLVKTLLRDWSVDSVTSARTGTPFNVLYDPATPGAFTGPAGQFDLRPDQVSGQPVWISDPNAPGGTKLNPAAFRVPPVIGQGSEARNNIRGFPLVEVDLAVRRQFRLTEGMNLQFRAEGFNVINHPNLGNPFNNIGTCSIGIPCTPIYGWGTSQAMLNQSLGGNGIYGTAFGSLYQVGGPRSLQLSLKLQF